jgi:ankyrin repeat protein
MQTSERWDLCKAKMQASKTYSDSMFDLARKGDLSAFKRQNYSGNVLDTRNTAGYTVLMLAALNDHKDLVQYLLSNGASPNAVDFGGNSILMGVAFKDNASIARLLLDYGADLELKNIRGVNALDVAVTFGRCAMSELLSNYQYNVRSLRHSDCWKQFV